jgi:putative ABC transport system permease protein
MNEGPRLGYYGYVFLTATGLAWDSLRAHKLRSFLTLLGIIIGVASVVLVGAAIDGLGVYAMESTAKVFGADNYLVAQIANVGRIDREELIRKFKRNKRLRPDDLDYLRLTTGDQILYSAYRRRSDDVRAGQRSFEVATILGASATMPEIRDVSLADGRFFTDQEEATRQGVAIIGEDIRAELFASLSPLDKVVTIRGLDFRVIGVQKKLGSVDGQSQDNQVWIPDTAFTRLYGIDPSMAVFGRPRPESGLSIDAAIDITRAALRGRFKTRPGEPDNFDTLAPDAIRSFVDQMLAMIAAVVVPVTAISLVVGGIVVMNIMLVSVTERTREIGVRKALGGRKSDILLQFLVESVVLSVIGGIAGLALGWGVSQILGRALEARLPVTLPYVVLSVAVSSLVGILSGWYPASRAAKMDPVAALRAE